MYSRRQLLFTRSVVPNSLWPHGLQHARLPCPSPSPGVCSNSCPLSCVHGCHPAISCSVTPFSPALNLSQHQGLFQWVERFFASCGQSSTASASVLPINIQCWFPLGLTCLISLLSKGLLQSIFIQNAIFSFCLVPMTSATSDYKG